MNTINGNNDDNNGQTKLNNANRLRPNRSIFNEEDERHLVWFNTIRSNVSYLKAMTFCNAITKFGVNNNKKTNLWHTNIEFEMLNNKVEVFGEAILKRDSKIMAIKRMRNMSEKVTFKAGSEFNWRTADFFKGSAQYMNAVMNSFRQDKDDVKSTFSVGLYYESDIEVCSDGFSREVAILFKNKLGMRSKVLSSTSKRLLRNSVDSFAAEQFMEYDFEAFEVFRDSIPLPQNLDSKLEDEMVIKALTGELEGEAAIVTALAGSLLGPIAKPMLNTAIGLTGNVLSGVAGLAGQVLGGNKPMSPIVQPAQQHRPESQIASMLYDMIQGQLGLDKMEDYTSASKIVPTYVDMMAVGVGVETAIESARLNPRRTNYLLNNPMVDVTDIKEICQIPSIMDYFSVNDTMVVKQLLYSKLIDPFTFKNTNVGYWSDYYDMWQGGFVISGKFFKTMFHNFAIMISYTPFVSEVTYEQAKSSVVCVIEDMKENSEFKVHIPFTSITGTRKTQDGKPMGVFRVWLQNVLAINGTASTAIECVVQIAGDQDFSYTGIVGQVGSLVGQSEEVEVVPVEEIGMPSTSGQTAIYMDEPTPIQTLVKDDFAGLHQMVSTSKGTKVTFTTNRMFQAASVEITSVLPRSVAPMASFSLMELLISDPCLINTTMFERTAQSVPEFTVTVVPNSVRTMAGALAVGVMYQPDTLAVSNDPYLSRISLKDGIKRGAQVIDFSVANQLQFKLPYFNRMPIVTQLDPDSNFLNYLYLYFWVLSPLQTGEDTADKFTVQVMLDMGDTMFTTIMPSFDCVGTKAGQLKLYGQGDEVCEGLLGTVNGISINMNEDHCLIGDVLKRYVQAGSYPVSGRATIPIRARFTENNSLHKAILSCFKNSRYSLDIMVEVKIPGETLMSHSVVLQPLDSNTVNATSDIVSTPAISSFDYTQGTIIPAIPNFPGLGQAALLTPDGTGEYGGQWYASGNASLTRWDVRSGQVSEPSMGPAVNNFNQNAPRKVANSNTNIITNDLDLLRNGVEGLRVYSTTNNGNMGRIKTSMDSNLGQNIYNNQVTSSILSSVNGVNTLAANSNTNAVKQNSNNVILANAVSGGSDVVLAGGVVVRLGWQPYTGRPTPDFATGQGCTMINTAINPVKVLAVPRYTNFNFEEINGLDANLNDYNKTCLYIGELLVYSDVPVVVDLKVRMSDEGQLIYFLGTETKAALEGQMESPDFIKLDGGQNDEKPSIKEKSVFSSVKSILTPKSVKSVQKAAEGAKMTPGKVDKLMDASIDCIGSIKENMNVMSSGIDKISGTTTGLIEDVKTSILGISEKFSKLIPSGFNISIDTIVASVLQLLMAILNPTPATIVMSSLSILLTLGIIGVSSLNKIYTFFMKIISGPKQNRKDKNDLTGECEHDCDICTEGKCITGCQRCKSMKDMEKPLFDDEAKATLLSLLTGGIAGVLGFKAHAGKGACMKLFQMNRSFWSTASGAKRFFSDLITMTKRIMASLLMKDKTLRLERCTANDDNMVTLYKEMVFLSSKLNERELLTNPDGQIRYMKAYCRALDYKALLMGNLADEHKQFYGVMNKFITGVELNMEVITNSIARREPFVIKYWGDSGVGKSFQSQLDVAQVVTRSLKKKVHGNMVYPLTGGVDFLNGYNQQPVLHIDEIFPVKDEPTCSQMSTFIMALKSSTPLNANMASLEDKKINITSEIVVMCTNQAFMVPKCVASVSAFLRRADMLVAQRWKLLDRHVDAGLRTTTLHELQTEFIASTTGRVKKCHYTPQELEDPNQVYEYLIFEDPGERDSYQRMGVDDMNPKWIGHTEFLEKYVQDVTDYVAQQKSAVLKRTRAQIGHLKSDIDLENDTMERVVEKSRIKMDSGGLLHEKVKEEMENKDKIKMLMDVFDKIDECKVTDITGEAEAVRKSWFSKIISEKVKNYTHGICGKCSEVTGISDEIKVLKYVCKNRSRFYMMKKDDQVKVSYDKCIVGICIECVNKNGFDIKDDKKYCDCEVGYTLSGGTMSNMKFVYHTIKDNYHDLKNSLKTWFVLFPNFDLSFLRTVLLSLLSIVIGCCVERAIKIHLEGEMGSIECTYTEPEVKVSGREFTPLDVDNQYVCNHVAMANVLEGDQEFIIDYFDTQWVVLTKDVVLRASALKMCNDDCELPAIRDLLVDGWHKNNPQAESNFADRGGSVDDLTVPPEIKQFLINRKSGNNAVPKQTKFLDKITKDSKWSKVYKILLWSGGILGVLGTIFGGYKMIKSMCSKKTFTGHYGHSGNKSIKGKISKGDMKNLTAKLKGQSEEMQREIIIKKIRRNGVIFKARVEKNDEEIRVRGLGIGKNLVLITLHEAKILQAYKKVGAKLSYAHTCEEHGEWVFKDCTDIKMQLLDNSVECGWNLVVCHLDKSKQFCDITKYVWSSKQIEYFTARCTAMTVDKRDYGVVHMEEVNIFNFNVNKQTSSNSIVNHTEELFNVFESDFKGKGLCGSLLIDRNSQTPIMGFHVSGNEYKGIQVPLVREFIEKILKISDLEGEAGDWLDGVKVVAVVEKDLVPFYSTKTSIRESIYWHDLKLEGFVDYTCPAVLSHKDLRWMESGITQTPLMVGASKHMRNPVKEFDQNLVDIAMQDVLTLVMKNAKPLINVLKPIDFNTAISGLVVGGSRKVEPMKLSSSAGWPHNLGSRKQKKDYIDLERNEYSEVIKLEYDVEKRELYEQELEIRMTGEPVGAVFQDAIKDERRKKTKLQPRVYSMGEMNQLITFKQAFGSFFDTYQRNFETCEHAVGMNVNGPEWTRLAERMQSKGQSVFDGDFQDFGPRLPKQFVIAAFQVMEKWYEHFADGFQTPEFEKWQKVRRALGLEVVNAIHLVMDIMYESVGGIPSGHPGTTPTNSLALKILLRVLWMMIMKDTGLSSMENFHKHVKIVVCGDDHLVNVSDEVKEIFNCMSIAETLAKFDFVYTDATKTGNIKYGNLSDVTFLKNGFKKHPTRSGHYLAPLEWNVVQETAMWYKKGMNSREASDLNCEQSLRLAYGHGPEIFKAHKDKLNRVLRSNKGNLVTLDWFELDRLIFEDEYCLIDDIIQYWE